MLMQNKYTIKKVSNLTLETVDKTQTHITINTKLTISKRKIHTETHTDIN